MRSELGLTWDDIVYNISYSNLIMLSRCTPNYGFDKKKTDKGIPKTSKSFTAEPPEFGAKGNIGGFKGLIDFFKKVKK